jgi:hypothetical protein
VTIAYRGNQRRRLLVISRTRATVTTIALLVAAIGVAAGASLGLLRLGQPESRVGQFPAVGPVGTIPSSTSGGLPNVTTRPAKVSGQTDHDTDD